MKMSNVNRGGYLIQDLDGNWITCKEAAAKYSLPRDVIYQRHKTGKRGKELFAPLKKIVSHKVFYKGEWITLYQLAKIGHIRITTVKYRYEQGERDPEILIAGGRKQRKEIEAAEAAPEPRGGYTKEELYLIWREWRHKDSADSLKILCDLGLYTKEEAKALQAEFKRRREKTLA